MGTNVYGGTVNDAHSGGSLDEISWELGCSSLDDVSIFH